MTLTQPFNQRLLALWADQNLVTPAFVYDEEAIRDNLQRLQLVEAAGCRLLYSIKALSYTSVLSLVRPHCSGFSVSSPFESRLAREIGGDGFPVHLTSPGLRPADVEMAAACCDYISFNSLSQWQRFRHLVTDMQTGLRVNPGISFARDLRFDPCRPHSKLGVPLADLPAASEPCWQQGLSGLHVHNNCESRDYSQLLQTLECLATARPDLLHRLAWLNLGGGYLAGTAAELTALAEQLQQFGREYGLQLFFEPGKAVVGNAGYLVASVQDLFMVENKSIAVLDTTVNHLPEVFEYQYRPAILQQQEAGEYSYQLAGASCLSGDIFGEYRFARPLEPGSRVIFPDVGAYMMVKANMFNGINLPDVYALQADGVLQRQKHYGFSDYRQRLGAGG